MKLSHLIGQANDTYRLRLDETEKRELQRRLVSAGYHADCRTSQTSTVIDAVLQTTDGLRSRHSAVASYSGMKVEAVGDLDGCPRCHQQMRRVELVDERHADYCGVCAITLPIRA